LIYFFLSGFSRSFRFRISPAPLILESRNWPRVIRHLPLVIVQYSLDIGTGAW
jgi:hypothetical protein